MESDDEFRTRLNFSPKEIVKNTVANHDVITMIRGMHLSRLKSRKLRFVAKWPKFVSFSNERRNSNETAKSKKNGLVCKHVGVSKEKIHRNRLYCRTNKISNIKIMSKARGNSIFFFFFDNPTRIVTVYQRTVNILGTTSIVLLGSMYRSIKTKYSEKKKKTSKKWQISINSTLF